MTACIGSGVLGDLLEWGHEIIPGTERHMFRVTGACKTSCTRLRPRCRRCESTRYDWAKKTDFRTKALSAHRRHASNMAREGFAESKAQGITLMNLHGVTVEFIATMFAETLNTECPGLCGFPDRHVITLPGDMDFDWRDPRSPLTPENCGPLCSTCNRQKHRMPWPEWIPQQRAIRANLEQAIPGEPPLRLFDPNNL